MAHSSRDGFRDGSREGAHDAARDAAHDSAADCPFCRKPSPRSVLCTANLAYVIQDRHPVSPGHALVVPRRHVADYFDLTDEEKAAVWELVDRVRHRLVRERSPDGFNVGLNAGKAAGQTVFHVHVHVIPRYEGDSDDPRGGVRWVLPETAPYWEREGA